LKPTKAKSLIDKTAKDLGESPLLVQDVVDFYYSTVKKKMESLDYPTLFLHNLGTLRLSRVKLKNGIKGLKILLSSNDQEDFKKVVKYNFSRELLEKKEKALENCNKYYIPLYEKRNQDLEGQGKDTGRDKK
jgi:hypothetical protein